MIKILIGFVLGVSVILSIPIVYSLFGNKTDRVAAESCESLKLGMTEDQVKALMGEPRDTLKQMQTDLTEYEVWNYGISPSGSGTISASFDLNSNRLMAFTCEEDFDVGFSRTNMKERDFDSLLSLENEISSIRIGQTSDSVCMQLGEPIREYSLFGKTVWQYNGLADGNGRPTITFDSASGKVLNVQAGLKYLTTEKDAIEILTIIYYQK